MTFGNVRIKDFLKKFLDDTAATNGTSTANVLELLIKNVYEDGKEVKLNEDLFANHQQLKDKLRVEANALEMFHHFWKQTTQDNYMTSSLFVKFIDIYNFITLDAAIELLVREVGIERLNIQDRNNYNSAYFARRYIFEHNIEEYSKHLNDFVANLDTKGFTFVNKELFFNILQKVLANTDFDCLINKDVETKVIKLSNFARRVAENSIYYNITGKRYENDYISNTHGLKNKLIKLIDSNYNMEYMSDSLFMDIVNMLYNTTITNNSDLYNRAFLYIGEISINCIKEFEDVLVFDENFRDYLNSNIENKSNDLMENLRTTMSNLHTNSEYTKSSKLNFVFRTPMNIIERCYSQNLSLLSNEKIRNLINGALPTIINSVISIYAKAGLYWYGLNKEVLNIKSTHFEISQSYGKTALIYNNGDIKSKWYFSIENFYKLVMIVCEHTETSSSMISFGPLSISLIEDKSIIIDDEHYMMEFDVNMTNCFRQFCNELGANAEYLSSCEEHFKFHGFI